MVLDIHPPARPGVSHPGPRDCRSTTTATAPTDNGVHNNPHHRNTRWSSMADRTSPRALLQSTPQRRRVCPSCCAMLQFVLASYLLLPLMRPCTPSMERPRPPPPSSFGCSVALSSRETARDTPPLVAHRFLGSRSPSSLAVCEPARKTTSRPQYLTRGASRRGRRRTGRGPS